MPQRDSESRPRAARRAAARLFTLAAGLGAPLLAAPAAADPAPAQTGPDRSHLRARPATAAERACSFTAPVCVHRPPDVAPWAARHVLRAAEAALSAYRGLGLPMPLPDAERGGTTAYDIYLSASAAPAETVPDLDTEPLPADEAAAYTLLPAPSTWGCDVASDVARLAAEALIFRLDAGAERGFVAAAASYLASVVAPCAAVEAPAVNAFQAAPHRALTEPASTAAHGGLLFPMFLEENAGAGDPGRLVMSLFAIASQKTEPRSPFWQNEPDAFDALRSSLRFRRGTLEDLLIDFAVDRAFVGDRSDGGHLWATDLYGAAGRVFFEWSVPYDTLPRRLAPLRPVEPTGATYLWLDLASAPKDAEISFVADWELPAVFRWSIVKVDKHGAEAGRVDIASIFGATHVERTIVLREELAGLLIAGTSTGSLDRTLPFDPDAAPHLPHAYEVTLYK